MVQSNKFAKYGVYLLAKAACSQADFSLKSADKLSDDFLGFLKLNLLLLSMNCHPQVVNWVVFETQSPIRQYLSYQARLRKVKGDWQLYKQKLRKLGSQFSPILVAVK